MTRFGEEVVEEADGDDNGTPMVCSKAACQHSGVDRSVLLRSLIASLSLTPANVMTVRGSRKRLPDIWTQTQEAILTRDEHANPERIFLVERFRMP